MLESGKRDLTPELRNKLVKFLGSDIPEATNPRNEVRPIVTRGSASIPYYRHIIHAGKGVHVLEDETEQFDIDEHYRGTAAYEVSGDSMADADIHEGDRLIVRLGYKFRPNDIILCRYNEELMVKGARIIDDTIWLIPANKKYRPWPCRETDRLEVIGVVIEVIRKPDNYSIKRMEIDPSS